MEEDRSANKSKISHKDIIDAAADLDETELKALCGNWLDKNHKIKLPDPETTDYNGYFDYFRHLPPSQLELISANAMLGVEGEAALQRWLDILAHPSRMKDISAAGLKSSEKESIVELAKKNDQLGTLEALRDQIADQLSRGTGARDTSSLAKSMTDIMDQIAVLKKRQGPAAGTPLANMLNRKRARGAGVRDRSYRAKTIKEIEASS